MKNAIGWTEPICDTKTRLKAGRALLKARQLGYDAPEVPLFDLDEEGLKALLKELKPYLT